MLLNELKKSTSPKHSDFKNIEKAVHGLEGVACLYFFFFFFFIYFFFFILFFFFFCFFFFLFFFLGGGGGGSWGKVGEEGVVLW